MSGDLDDALVEAQVSGSVASYTFRHGVPPAAASTTTALQGYGVNLDIKNMEYQNLDDGGGSKDGKPDGTDAAAADVSFEEGEEVGGFVFSTLHRRRPGLGPGLAALRQEMVDSAADGGDMKVWRMKDLGLQVWYSSGYQ